MTDITNFDEAMERLKAGDQQVARQVFVRFVGRLVALAGSRLEGKVRRKVDPEDVVQSVFNSFFARHKADQYQLADWDGLWGLLAAITIRKCGHKIEHFRAACRDLADEESTSFLTDASRADWVAAASDPTPAQIAMFDETILGILQEMEERERHIFLLALQGWSSEEIAAEVGCSIRTARRVLHHARMQLEQVRDELS